MLTLQAAISRLVSLATAASPASGPLLLPLASQALARLMSLSENNLDKNGWLRPVLILKQNNV